MAKNDTLAQKTASNDDSLDGPMKRLVGHYQTHGYPKGVGGKLYASDAKLLAHSKARDDIHTYVRDRIRQLTISDPFFLSDPQKTELRIVGAMANQLGTVPKVQLFELPRTDEEMTFVDHFESSPPPLDIAELEKYLAQYALPKKEGLAIEVRALIARMIMIRYLQDAKNLRRILISPVLQNFFTCEEYAYMIKNTDPKVCEALLYRPAAQDDFIRMDDDVRPFLLEKVAPQRKHENEFFRTTCKPVPSNLSLATRTALMRLAIFFQNERALIAFFEAYPDGDSISMMFREVGESCERNIFALGHIFLQQLPPEEKKRIDWKTIFEKFTQPSPHFLVLLEHVPADLHDATTWDTIMNAAMAQNTEHCVYTAFGLAPKDLLSLATYAKLLELCSVNQWSDHLYRALSEWLNVCRERLTKSRK